MDPDGLYGVPFERFTPERDALAKQLRKEGERDEAGRVSKLRKPSLAAWAVNQLVRTQRKEVDQLFKAGDALQKAQADLLRGRGDSAKLRRAADAERAATDELLRRAAGLLNSEGQELTPARLEQVSETLHAAALDDEARASVIGGCLERELRHVGLGALVAPGAAPRAATGAERAPAPPKLREQAAERKAARLALSEARRRMERAERELQSAQERRDRVAVQLSAADEQLDEARDRAAEARAAHQAAELALAGD